MRNKLAITACLLALCSTPLFSAAIELKKFILASQSNFCAAGMGSFSKTIRAFKGDYCSKDIGAAVAMAVCSDAAGFSTSSKGGSDCFKMIKKNHPQLANVNAAQQFVMSEPNKARVCNFLLSQFDMSKNGCHSALGLPVTAKKCPAKISISGLSRLNSTKIVDVSDARLKLLEGAVHKDAFEAQYTTTDKSKCYYLQYDSNRNLIITPSLALEVIN